MGMVDHVTLQLVAVRRDWLRQSLTRWLRKPRRSQSNSHISMRHRYAQIWQGESCQLSRANTATQLSAHVILSVLLSTPVITATHRPSNTVIKRRRHERPTVVIVWVASPYCVRLLCSIFFSAVDVQPWAPRNPCH